MIAIVPLLLSLPQAAPTADRPATSWEITRRYRTSETSSEGSTGSSNGTDTLTERLITTRDDGVELEYDLPAGTTGEERARSWQFPARVFRPTAGRMRLLNADQLASRLAAWLEVGKLDRSACGRTVFTWAAFKIECDPQAVLATLAAIDLRSDLRAGQPYADPQASAPARLVGGGRGPLTATSAVDPDAIRHERAEADVVVGEIMRQPITLDAALAARAKEEVSGTIHLVLDRDATGGTVSRTRVMTLAITRPDGTVERRERTEVVERR